MSSAGVLLNRCVDFSFDEDDDESSSAAAAVKSMGGTKAASFIPALYQATVAVLGSMKPADAVLPQPPEIATFRLRGSKTHQGSLSSRPLVACADKSLLVLYAGHYFGPGSSKYGCYLVYDAAAAAAPRLSTVPPPPNTRCLTRGIVSGAVVQRLHPAGPSSAYLLAELATTPKREFPDPDAVLLLWRSDEQPTPQWVRKEVHLPREVCLAPGSDKHMFQADTSFSGPDGCLCWVDLLQGIVVCTNPHQDAPVLRFVPLPDGCPAVSATDYPYRPRAEESRSAACIGGRIKFVAMVGELVPGCDAHQFRLTTWTLSPGLDGGWQQDGVFRLEDLWATPEYRALGLPPHTPLCPVLSLSAREDGAVVVYALVNDIEERLVVQGHQVVLRTELQFKRQYVLGIDMRHNKIVSTSSGMPPESLMHMAPRLLSVDFGASLQKNRQREVQASQVGDSGKKLKV